MRNDSTFREVWSIYELIGSLCFLITDTMFHSPLLLLLLFVHARGFVYKETDQQVFFDEKAGYMPEGKWVVTFVNDLNYITQYYTQIRSNLQNIRNMAKAVRTILSGKDHQESYITAIESQFWKCKDQLALLESKHTAFFRQMSTFGKMNRRKRALLPLGNFFKFLFGTGTDEDVATIKTQVQNLMRSQNTVLHSVEKGISIMNLTRSEIAENREAINTLIESAKSMKVRVEKLEGDIFDILIPLHDFVLAYLHIESCLTEVEFLVNRLLGQY